MKIFVHIFFNLQLLFVLIACLISLYALRYRSTPRYMKFFLGYTCVGFFVMVPNFCINYFFKDLAPVMDKILVISTIYHFVFLGYFIIHFSHGNNKRWIYLVAFLFLVTLIFSIVSGFSKRHNNSPFSISSIGLILLCFVYFYRLLKFPSNFNLTNFPAFWIIVGVFLSTGIQFPFATAFDSFYRKVSSEKSYFFSGMISFSFIVLQVFIIKSYVCSIKNSKKLLL